MQRISSRRNVVFKTACKLAESARERTRAQRTLLDGTRLIAAYSERFGLEDAILLVEEEASRQSRLRSFIEGPSRQVFVLAASLFRDVAQIESPEGISAIVGIPCLEPPERDEFRLLIDGVQDPGNLGNLLRTAAAAGATSAWLCKGCADAWSPKSLRGGMGAQFVLPVRQHVRPEDALEDFSGNVLATTPRGRKSIYDVDLTRPTVFVFGSEGRGLGQETLSLTTELVYIPMFGSLESLNVGAAAAVCCFERARQVKASPKRERGQDSP